MDAVFIKNVVGLVQKISVTTLSLVACIRIIICMATGHGTKGDIHPNQINSLLNTKTQNICCLWEDPTPKI